MPYFLIILVLILIHAVSAQKSPLTIVKVGEWGIDSAMSNPHGVSFDSTGNVYVCDTNNHRIQKFTLDGKYLMQWYGDENGGYRFHTPLAIQIGPGDFSYITDCYNYAIRKFDSTGKQVKDWSVRSKKQKRTSLRDPEMRIDLGPVGLAVDSKGNVYVGDTEYRSVLKYTSDGEYITEWLVDGKYDDELGWPGGLCVDSKDNVYVVNHEWHRVEKYTPDGEFITQWGGKGGGNSQLYWPSGIIADQEDSIYVSDAGNHRIQKFTNTGKFLFKFGRRSSSEKDFYQNEKILDIYDNNIERAEEYLGMYFNIPIGIVIKKQLDKIVYIADARNNRIQYFIEIFDIPAPSNLQITRGIDRVIITWIDNSQNETGFEIQRSLAITPPEFITVGTVGPNVTSFTDLLNPDIEAFSFIYQVRALGAEGSGPFSGQSYSSSSDFHELDDHNDCGATGILIVFVVFSLYIFRKAKK